MALPRSLVLAALLCAWRAPASTGIDLTTDFVSEYVFRGANMHQGTSVQSSLNYNLLDTLTASLWTNLSLEGGFALAETDYSLKWTWLHRTRAAFTVGAVHYDRSRAALGPETSELFAGVDLNVPGKPSLYAWYDWNNHPGTYYQLGLRHRFMLPDYRGTFDISGDVGFDSGRLNGWQDARVSLAVTRLVGDWRLSPALDLHLPARQTDPNAHHFRPVFRVSAARSF
jgi:hypothetical protein